MHSLTGAVFLPILGRPQDQAIIMAGRILSALEGGLHERQSGFQSAVALLLEIS